MDCGDAIKSEFSPYILSVFAASTPAFAPAIEVGIHIERLVESVTCQLPTGTVGRNVEGLNTASGAKNLDNTFNYSPEPSAKTFKPSFFFVRSRGCSFYIEGLGVRFSLDQNYTQR